MTDTTETSDPTEARTRIERYDPTAIEPRWQARWAELGLYETDLLDDVAAQVLPADDVPVPVGRPAHRPLVHRHARPTRSPASAGCTATTCSSRSASMPSGCRPRTPRSRTAATRATWTMQNIENMRRQFRTMGATFDWEHEVVTADPDVLPLEPVAVPALPGGRPRLPRRCRRSTGAPTTGRSPASRSRAPTATAGAAARWSRSATWSSGSCARPTYADELLDFTGIDWPEPIRIQQTNWIGRSEGAEIDFETAPDDHQPGGDRLRVFTTRPDTLFGATFMVLAPGAPAGRDADRTRTAGPRSRRTSSRPAGGPRSSGCRPTARRPASPLGADAINPVNGERIPIFIADYVLSGYGTGRDHGRARPRRARLRVRRAVRAADPAGRRRRPASAADAPMDDAYIAHAADERLVNSGRFDGLPRRRGRQGDRRRAGRDRPRRAQGHLPPARLADQPPALLGHADPGHLLPERDGIVPGPRRGPAGPPARDGRLRAAAATTRSTTTRRSCTSTCPTLRRPGPARDRHDGHVHRLVVVLVPLPVAATRRTAPVDRAHGRSLDAGRPVHRRRRARGHAPAVQPLLHQGDGATSAWSATRTSRSSGCSTRARSWAPTASG